MLRTLLSRCRSIYFRMISLVLNAVLEPFGWHTSGRPHHRWFTILPERSLTRMLYRQRHLSLIRLSSRLFVRQIPLRLSIRSRSYGRLNLIIDCMLPCVGVFSWGFGYTGEPHYDELGYRQWQLNIDRKGIILWWRCHVLSRRLAPTGYQRSYAWPQLHPDVVCDTTEVTVIIPTSDAFYRSSHAVTLSYVRRGTVPLSSWEWVLHAEPPPMVLAFTGGSCASAPECRYPAHLTRNRVLSLYRDEIYQRRRTEHYPLLQQLDVGQLRRRYGRL